MNTRTKKLSTLCAALGSAGLARTGAMLALALGAAQAGAATYTVPLQFDLTLAPPVCSLTVGGHIVNATGNTSGATSPVINLTTNALPVINSPVNLLTQLQATLVADTITGQAPGVWHDSNFVLMQKRLNSAYTPTASANCTAGTPMVAKVARVGSITGAVGSWLAGFQLPTAGSGQLPLNTPSIGMLMGISMFGLQSGANGSAGGTTYNGIVPAVATTATGSDQTLSLVAAIYTDPGYTTPLAGGSSGLWSYKFNVTLDF